MVGEMVGVDALQIKQTRSQIERAGSRDREDVPWQYRDSQRHAQVGI